MASSFKFINMSNTAFGKQGWMPNHITTLSGKTYLITGANAGAGFEAAKILLSKNAEVVILNRNEEKTKQAIAVLKAELGDAIKVSYAKTDLAQLDSVRAAAEKIKVKFTKIDALICNAAVAQIAKQEFTFDGFESQLGINY